MIDLVDRIKNLLEAGRCLVSPHGGMGVEIQLTYATGHGSDVWVQRWKDHRGTMISAPGSRALSLSNADAAKLDEIINKLVYEERDKRAWYLLQKLDHLEKGLPL